MHTQGCCLSQDLLELPPDAAAAFVQRLMADAAVLKVVRHM